VSARLGVILRSSRAAVAIALALVLVMPAQPAAHELPRRVVVRAFARVDSSTLILLVRVPLEAMRDVEFPTRGDGFLDISRSDRLLRDAAMLWVAGGVVVYDGGAQVTGGRVTGVRISLPSDGAFHAFESAAAGFDAPPLPDSVEIPWQQALVDVRLEYPVGGMQQRLALDPRWGQLGVTTTTVLRVVGDRGSERVLSFEGNPGRIGLDPPWYAAAARFVTAGFTHILDGVDHLLFLVCLVIPVRRLWPLVGIVTAFTVAHSITLGAAALGFVPDALWFPALIEMLIAFSIVFMAAGNILGARLDRRWQFAFVFGLVHGFGFSFALRDSLQFAGSHLVMALASFNLGVELGQLLVLAAVVPLLALLHRYVQKERAIVIVLSAVVAHQAWHWMTARFSEVQAYRMEWPVLDRLFLAGAMRFAMLLLVSLGAMWAYALLLAKLRAMHAARTAVPLAAVLLLLGAVPAVGAQSMTRTTMAGVFTERQANQGREVFNGACSGCHTSASHTGPVFTNRWIGQPLSELFGYLRSEMPKTNPGELSEEEYVWVTAYLLKINGMPAGAVEMTGDPQQLRQVRIDTTAASRQGLSHLRPALQHWRTRQ
jgi:mono/diheme cytochrome c family protein